MTLLARSRLASIFVFSIFSYFSNLAWLVVDLLPHFIRKLLFKIAFGELGRGGVIDYQCFVRYPWRVSIGNDVAINRGCELYPSMKTEQGTITLEANVVLSPGVVIYAAGHDYKQFDLPDISAPVIIERNVWVGGRAIILPGVTIGEAAVIGAGSVVSKDIPAYSVAVGNPAKVIKIRKMRDSKA